MRNIAGKEDCMNEIVGRQDDARYIKNLYFNLQVKYDSLKCFINKYQQGINMKKVYIGT